MIVVKLHNKSRSVDLNDKIWYDNRLMKFNSWLASKNQSKQQSLKTILKEIDIADSWEFGDKVLFYFLPSRGNQSDNKTFKGKIHSCNVLNLHCYYFYLCFCLCVALYTICMVRDFFVFGIYLKKKKISCDSPLELDFGYSHLRRWSTK